MQMTHKAVTQAQAATTQISSTLTNQLATFHSSIHHLIQTMCISLRCMGIHLLSLETPLTK
jgi:hypothetical protein